MRIRVIIYDKETGEIYSDSTTRNIFDITSDSFHKMLVDDMKHYNRILQVHTSARLSVIPFDTDYSQPDIFNKYNY